MRQIYITFTAALMALVANAHPISPGEAETIATDFFNSGSATRNTPHKVARAVTPNTQFFKSPAYYIFNADDNNGFVIVSGDSRTKSILGYSDKGSFNAEQMPTQLIWLLNEYQKGVESLPAESAAPRQKVTRSEDQVPLLSTQWGQDAPYNEKCPILFGTHAKTGCVATAMAQIINYEKKSNHVAEIPEYWCEVYMPPLPEYDFNLGNLDDEGIATLMLYCGQSVRMGYGAEESGAAPQDVPDALRSYFGWEESVRVMDRGEYNDDHWNRMVKEEIAAGHPLFYSAVSETSGWHAFVIDGVADDMFHVNWGWDGYMDGYFSFQPFATDNKSEFVNMQWMVTTRDDDPSADVITYGTTIDGINYQLNEDLTAAVLPLKYGEKYRGELVIPSYVNYEGQTYKVNYFGPNAFVKCEHLESLSIPATIEGQAWSIFDGCINLRRVNVEDMAAFIKLEVGGWWTGSPLWEGADLYLNGELVKDLVIPEGIEEIGYCKFANCTSIESVTMPSTMKVAGQYSFAKCPNLKRVDMLQSSLEIIDILAFVNDYSLEEIKLPTTLKEIRGDAFGQVNGRGCEKLRKIVSLATTPPWSVNGNTFIERHYSDAVVYVPDASVEEYQIAKEWSNFLEICPLSEEKPLPETTLVSDKGLQYEVNLTEKYAKLIGKAEDFAYSDGCTIPYSVEYNNQDYPVEVIGYSGAWDLNISKIEAPVRKIGTSAFVCASFEDVFETPAEVKTIGYRAFFNTRIPYLILSENILSIGSQAFEGQNDWLHVLAIESRNPQPPTISEDTFDSMTYNESPLMVPFGFKKAYASAPGWRNFNNISNIGAAQEETYDNDLTLSASIPNNIPVKDRMPITIAATVRNSGMKGVSGFTLSWYIDEEYLGEKEYDVELAPDEIYSFEDKIVAKVNDAGTHELKLVVKIDDIDDQDTSDNIVVLAFDSFEKGYYRVSLIEQYTTEACSITPLVASKIPDGIKNSGYSDFVAYVTHHCGYYGDFLTLNDDYEWFYGDYGYFTPAMMLNRSDIYETGYTIVNNIRDDVDRRIISEAGLCNALVSVYCDVRDDKVCVKTLLEKDGDFDLTAGYDYVTVFLVEDSIPAQEQVDPWSDGFVEDFIHRNALRKVLSGPWGNKISWKDDICALKFESDIDLSWNTDNLKAIAFIHRYDPTSKLNCQVYTANSSALPQYGRDVDDNLFEEAYVGNIKQDAEIFDVYTIMGVKVKANATDCSGLPAGIYICNGKKVYVK